MASDFLRENWPEGTLPIEVDDIADVRFGIDVIPVPGLREIGIDGFICSCCTKIVIDDLYFTRLRSRARFTIAHEMAHLVLHRDLVEASTVSNIDDYRAFRRVLSDQQERQYEQQAHAFAGLILVPPDRLASEIEAGKALARTKGLNMDLANPQHRDRLCSYLARQFDVSQRVIGIRGSRDRYWRLDDDF